MSDKQDGTERLKKNGLTPGNPGNSGGKPGRSGRKPLAFKELCKDILEDEATQQAIREAATDSKSRGYSALIKMLASYSEGLPVKRVSLSTDDEPLEIRIVKE